MGVGYAEKFCGMYADAWWRKLWGVVEVDMLNSDVLRVDSYREMRNLRPGNRLRMMFGLSLLPQDGEVVTSASQDAGNGLCGTTQFVIPASELHGRDEKPAGL